MFAFRGFADEIIYGWMGSTKELCSVVFFF